MLNEVPQYDCEWTRDDAVSASEEAVRRIHMAISDLQNLARDVGRLEGWQGAAQRAVLLEAVETLEGVAEELEAGHELALEGAAAFDARGEREERAPWGRSL